jgi:hypothetical protein
MWYYSQMKRVTFALLAASLFSLVHAKEPDCTSANQYPAQMAQSQLNAAGLFDTLHVDFTKTTVSRVSSQKVGRDLYRQVHDVRFIKTDGSVIEAIVVGTVSSEECGGSQFDVYLVSHKIELPPSEYDPSVDRKNHKK